jgi:hypothetical protein
MPKIQPAVKTFELRLGGLSPIIGYADIGQIASVVNRRAYRQGMQWMVGGITVVDMTGTGSFTVTVQKLPETWVVAQAWKAGFQAWQKQQKEALMDSNSMSAMGRYRDFKIFADTGHAQLGTGANLRPVDALSSYYLAGEWDASDIVVPHDPGHGVNTSYTIKMIGTSGSSKALISGYAQSRARPQSLDPAHPAIELSWLNQMFDTGGDNDDVIDHATNENDDAPYDIDDYPGSTNNAPTMEIVASKHIDASNEGREVGIPGFVAPCGLLRFEINEGATARIFIHMVPGPYRGYMAAPMGEM